MPTLMCTSRKRCRVHQQQFHQQLIRRQQQQDEERDEEKQASEVEDQSALTNEQCVNKDDILDFVVIGNGPSGICLSYLLSGNWPYYNWNSEDDMLHARLMEEPDLSLVEQDLEFLSDGLEGRSSNPVSVLLDTLQRPKADLGLDLASNLVWRKDEARASSHVVLGHGRPGGVWQKLDGNLKTVSLGAWMQLPNLSMPEWKQHSNDLMDRRTNVSNVSQYYTDYVDIMGLTQNFRNCTTVTKVRRIKPSEVCCILKQNICDNKPKKEAFSLGDKKTIVPNNLMAKGASPPGLIANDASGNSSTKYQQCADDSADKNKAVETSDDPANLAGEDPAGDQAGDEGCDDGCLDVDDAHKNVENICVCEDCWCLQPCQQMTSCDEDVFSLDDDDISSVCSSLTHHSVSPLRETRESESSSTDCWRSNSLSSCGGYRQQHSNSLSSCGGAYRQNGSTSLSSCGGPPPSSSSIPSCSGGQSYLQADLCPVCSCGMLDPACCCTLADPALHQPTQPASQTIPIPMSDEFLCPSWDPIINPSLFSLTINSWANRLSSSSWATRPSCTPMSSSQHRRDSLPNIVRCEKLNDPGTLFEVSGYEVQTLQDTNTTITIPFTYMAHNVVLATGLNKPKKLSVPGENLNFVYHQLRDLDSVVARGGITPNSDPVLVVGAGLTAADSIISAQAYNIPVIHVFRRSVKDPQMILNKLPMNLYPEYEKVRSMMAGGSVNVTKKLHGGEKLEAEHPMYTAYAETSITAITKDREVVLRGPDSETKVKVSCVLVLIGASLQLDFLDSESQGLGRNPGEPVDKNNPVDIDVYTHQSVNLPGIFALGPLVGDNFVRFLQGGALAIASFAHKAKQDSASQNKTKQDSASQNKTKQELTTQDKTK